MSIADTWAMSRPAILKLRASFFSLVPLQTGHTVIFIKLSFFSSDSSLSSPVMRVRASTPSKVTIWSVGPLPTLNSSWEP